VTPVGVILAIVCGLAGGMLGAFFITPMVTRSLNTPRAELRRRQRILRAVPAEYIASVLGVPVRLDQFTYGQLDFLRQCYSLGFSAERARQVVLPRPIRDRTAPRDRGSEEAA
jgi:hypothetical protein